MAGIIFCLTCMVRKAVVKHPFGNRHYELIAGNKIDLREGQQVREHPALHTISCCCQYKIQITARISVILKPIDTIDLKC